MSLSFICRYLFALLLFVSQLTAKSRLPDDDLWFSDRMTPQEIRQYGYHAAKDFTLVVSQVLSLSKNEDSFQEVLSIWEKAAITLFTDVCALREGSQSSNASQIAADEVLDTIHVIVIGAFVDTDLIHLLSTCAWHCLDESNALEFENRFTEFFFQLLSQLNPPSNPPTYLRMEVFRPNFSWDSMNASVVLCGGKAEVSVKGDTDGNASVGGKIEVNHETEKGTTYSAEASASVEKDKDGQTSERLK